MMGGRGEREGEKREEDRKSREERELGSPMDIRVLRFGGGASNILSFLDVCCLLTLTLNTEAVYVCSEENAKLDGKGRFGTTQITHTHTCCELKQAAYLETVPGRAAPLWGKRGNPLHGEEYRDGECIIPRGECYDVKGYPSVWTVKSRDECQGRGVKDVQTNALQDDWWLDRK
ncbi:hypothetical protein BJ684DRAFT_17129 [Piptocephalis cylindrospora]|uniref:Uncharacterized protein n=1 Tax=Piptocephalis cylindrospora TaxID=1907219 RepID=A0A4P9Y0V3_9FUNG|nr:hypothetical protein BJ684DRAFT_17129 [Piptocephalis cylindrospora]|eukprot:RKP12373.1 hypothetical protein BJ684DRAFT_17129 [Piptocephalis cylindrospora]